MHIIGLGQAGCSIAEKFKQYSQYKVYKIDVDLKGKNCFNMPYRSRPEDYESNFPVIKIRAFLKGIKNDTLFIASCGNVSGATLRILEILKKNKCNINFLYIKPDLDLLNETRLMQEKAMFGILQEYARSAVFDNIYFVSNPRLSAIVGDIPIKQYFEALNTTVASTYHMINVFKHSKSIMGTFSNTIASARISTFGLIDYKTSEEKMFFSLDNVRDKRYYYAIPEKILDEDVTFLNKMKKQVKEKVEHDNMKISYGVFATQYADSYIYCEAKSSAIQKNT